MVTEGTREGGSSMNKGQGRYFDRDKKPGGGTRFPKTDRQPRGERQANGERTSRGEKPYGDRPPRNERPNRNYGGAPKFSKKDDDEEDRGRRSKPSHPKENKPSVVIPDKNKVQMRLEKEQKSMKKKQNNKKRESSRPQPKQKRSNNINYTKNYANGAYDDYEDYDDLY